MILVASISVVSGVIVAALYHQQNMRPVPRWLRKINGMISSSDAVASPKTTAAMNCPFAAEMKPCSHDSESKVVPLNDNRQRESGQDGDDAVADSGAEWQMCAMGIDRLTGKIACAVTLIAVIVTIFLLVATPG